jgi:hemolysin activation/secretion protein
MRTLFVQHKKIFHLALLVVVHAVHAQQPPSAGSQLQQIPAAPTPPVATPELRLQRSRGAVAPPSDGTRILVKKIQVTGARTFSEDELIDVTGFKPGSELTLSDLRAMASKITDYYRGKGFFVAEGYLPEQDIKDNVVTIAVSEGRYGKVVLRNETNLSTPLAKGLLDGINTGDVIATGPLENRLLLLSDLPGVNVSSTLVPGTTVGTSDLLVDVAPGRRVTGSIDADNAGNRYTGQYASVPRSI